MKAITKRNEPASLTQHRANQPAYYDNLPKDETRNSLLTEQGHICCYCMRRIPEAIKIPGSKIEHFLCQDDHSQEELNYGNMLLACLGNEGSPKRIQTCDSHKGNLTLTHNPSNNARNIEGLIKYKSNGEIYSTDDTLNTELETVLNLNVKLLKDNRRAIYETVQNRIRNKVKQHKTNTLQKRFLESEKRKWFNLADGKYMEFCMVGVYVIDKKLKKIV
ncbi:MAG: TIGR02646 family protein [Flavobacteriaceae bacterium]|nr:MAG: TIGR02646 family protein [Flavobacteriaceae bacterium]